MSKTRWLLPVVLVGVALADEPEKPRDLGLKESASTELAQIDVTVSGPAEAIAGLAADDFEVWVNGKPLLAKVFVDALCGEPRAPEVVVPSDVAAAPDASIPGPRKAPVSYLVYFDMPHLTVAGRQFAIDAAREMLPNLLAGGNSAMLVSNAAELRTLVPMTMDAARLDIALAKLVDDPENVDTYAAMEDLRIAQVLRPLLQSRGPMGIADLERAKNLARNFAVEEQQRQMRDLARLRMALRRLSELDPPKAALYFADTMRQNPGEHYQALFSTPINIHFDGGPTLDRVINEASANGIRFYTVEGQGLTGDATFIQSGNSPTNSGNRPSTKYAIQRVHDAQNTLVSLAAETGGRAFLRGVPAAKIANRILTDFSCLYLLSFHPGGFKRDAPLSVAVKVRRPVVKAETRGRLVIASESTKLTSRLLAAYDSAETSNSLVRVGVIPVGFRAGLFTARVQVAVPASVVPAATWDLGASLVMEGEVLEDASGRILLSRAGIPAVWEQDMSFDAGEFAITALAHERTSDVVASKEIHGSWPKLKTDPVSFGPIAVTQQTQGGFLRNGTSATSGAIVVGEDDPLQAGAPTAVVSLVCRAKQQKDPIHVVRTLHGVSEIPIGASDVQMESSERCAQILDLIPPKTLGAGSYRYVITASSGGAELARAERKLLVPE